MIPLVSSSLHWHHPQSHCLWVLDHGASVRNEVLHMFKEGYGFEKYSYAVLILVAVQIDHMQYSALL